MQDIIKDAIKILSSYVNEPNTPNYLIKGSAVNINSIGDLKTNSLMNWKSIVEQKGDFYNTFSNSSLLNVLHYVKGGRGYVEQYNASKNEDIFNNFKGLEAIMNLYMMGSNNGEIDFQSLFADNSIGERSVGVGAAFVFKKVDTKSYYGSIHPGQGWSCVTVANGSGYSCTKDIYDSVKTEKYNYLNDIYNSIFKTDITLNNQDELNNIKFDSKQSLGQPIDNYVFRDTYMAPNGRAVSSNDFKIDGFINLLMSIVNSKSNEYMLVKSDAKKDRYYAYKKLDNPEIIRTHDDNYNSLYMNKASNSISFGQFLLDLKPVMEKNGILWEKPDPTVEQGLYNKFNSSIGDLELFNITSINDYLTKKINVVKNNKTGDSYQVDMNEVTKDVIFKVRIRNQKLEKYNRVENVCNNGQCWFIFDKQKNDFVSYPNGEEVRLSEIYPQEYGRKYIDNPYLDLLSLSVANISAHYKNGEKDVDGPRTTLGWKTLEPLMKNWNVDNVTNDAAIFGNRNVFINGTEIVFKRKISGGKKYNYFNNPTYDLNSNIITFNDNGADDIKITMKGINVIQDSASNSTKMSMGIDYFNSLADSYDQFGDIKDYSGLGFDYNITKTIGVDKFNTNNENKYGSFTIDKNITNDKEQTLNGITDFNITINNNNKKLYNYHLSYDLKPNETCGENFVKVGGKCYYKHPATRIEKENVASTFALRPNISNDGCIYGPGDIYICPEVTPPTSPTPPSTEQKPNQDKEVSNNALNGTESDGVLFNFTQEDKTIINNLPQRKEFTLSYGFRDGSGVYTEVGEEIFTTGMDMVRNPYGTTLSGTKKVSLFALPNTDTCIRNELTGECITPGQEQLPIPKPQLPKHCAIETIDNKEQVVCDGNAWLKEEFIPYDLKEWLFEKQYTELVGEQRKEINGYVYKVDAKYLSKLSKNNTIRIGFALVGKDGVVNVNEQMQLKFVNDIGGSGYHGNTYNLSSPSETIISEGGIFYYDLTEKEKILFKNVYNEDYARFVDEYIFKNYIIEVEKDKLLNLSDVYTLKAMSFHDNRWSYLDYNQNGIMDERLDSTNQYYDQKGEIVFGESRTQFTPEIKPGLDNTVVGPNWHTSQIAGLTEWKMFRFYTKEGYKYYITGYNRNNGSNIIK